MKNKPKTCFLIGPMKNMARLKRLQREIIAPALEPFNFTVVTPEEGKQENIMRQVMMNLEQADLLIADITGLNPNVMYELGIYHAFGKPYLTVKEKGTGGGKASEDTPFDIAAYRFLDVDFADVGGSREVISHRAGAIVAGMDTTDWFSNPVTDFYNAPIAEIPTAIGLFKNYRKNFLNYVLPGVFQRLEHSTAYVYDVQVQEVYDPRHPEEGYRSLTLEERGALRFEVRIPRKLFMAGHDYIRGLKVTNADFPFKNARVGRQSRPFNLYMRPDGAGHWVLTDIPTVLGTLNDAVRQRRELHNIMFDEKEWLELEMQELKRFKRKCDLFCTEVSRIPECRGRVKIVYPATIK